MSASESVPPKFWDLEQYDALVQAAGELSPDTLALILLMGDCGLRAGEVLALEWKHLRKGPQPQIEIQRSYTSGHFGPPKGARPRTVPITARTAAALRSLPRSLLAPWVFTAEQAGEVTDRTLWSVSWSVCRADQLAGIGGRGSRANPRGSSTSCATTYVTRLAAAMAPAWITLRYMHLVPGATSAAVAAFDQASAVLGQDRGRDRAPKTETAS